MTKDKRTDWGKLGEILSKCTSLFSKNPNLEGVVVKANTEFNPEPISKKLAENVTATQTNSKNYYEAIDATQPQCYSIHVLTSPPEVTALSFYMLNIANKLNFSPRSVDLRILLSQEPFIPETYRGREIRIVGVVVLGQYVPKEDLIPDMLYYLSAGTSILGGEDITPENGGQKFYDFLFNSLGQSFASGNSPPELPGRLVRISKPTIKPEEEKQ